jgi:predicted DNA-binding protein with PD1-like motif
MAPKDYTPPGPVTNLGRAPGLQTRLLAENPGGERTYAVIFAKGDEIMSGLTEFAVREKLVAAQFSAIGALESARFGWFDRAQKAYRDIPVDHQVELISLIGDVGLVNGVPAIHAHGAVGDPDGQVHGGHILEAIVWPTLELFLTAYRTPLIKTHDAETNLSLFDLKDRKDGLKP